VKAKRRQGRGRLRAALELGEQRHAPMPARKHQQLNRYDNLRLAPWALNPLLVEFLSAAAAKRKLPHTILSHLSFATRPTLRPTLLRATAYPIDLYKIMFHFKASVHELIILISPPPPTSIAYTTAVLLHDYWAMYDPPSTPLLYAILHILLVITISCKGQIPYAVRRSLSATVRPRESVIR